MRWWWWWWGALGLLWVGCSGDGGEDRKPGDDGEPTGVPTGFTGLTGDTGGSEALPGVTDCGRELAAPPAGELCAVSGSPSTATHVLLQGDVLGDGESYLGGEIIVERGENGTIACVGCDCAAETPAEVVIASCPDTVISPGLINAHDHIRYAKEQVQDHGLERYDHRSDWRVGNGDHTVLDTSSQTDQETVLYGELRMLMGGATSIAGSISSANASGLLRNLDNAAYNEGLGGWRVNYATFPLGDIDGRISEDSCSPYFIDRESELSDRIYLPHIAEGIDAVSQNEFQCLAGLADGGRNLIADNTSIVHGIGLDASDIEVVANRGAQIVWSLRSNLSLYGDTAPVVAYDQVGVPVALGTDWVPSGSASLLRELACADEYNALHLGGYFDDRDLWLMVTRNAAIATGADGQLGRLRPGFVADVAVFAKRGRSLHRAVLEAGIEDVALVMRGSAPLLGDADLLAGLTDTSTCEALSECLQDHVVCMDGGLSLADVVGAAGSSAYPLYLCEPPDDEPTCVPRRDDEDGDGVVYPTSSPDDTDLDGVDDSEDNCPEVFNPPRPMDLFLQGDEDGDGAGDACDVCPNDAQDRCDWLDPDGDGVEGLDDNCPQAANGDQVDTDGDLIGDACDECPSYASTIGRCPQTVYDVKRGKLEGRPVLLEDMLVTAVEEDGFFLQADPAGADYDGPGYSGIYVYAPRLDAPEVADLIDIRGQVQGFYGQIQLSAVEGWDVRASGRTVPDPVLVKDPADVATGGSQADALEGVLVTVEDVEVLAEDLPAGPGDRGPTYSFEVEGGLVIDDLLYRIEPSGRVGERFASLTGVLQFAHDASRLEVRSASDVVFGPARVDALSPEVGFVEAGTTAADLLTVALLRAPTEEVAVALDCAKSSLVSCPETVTVDAGELTAAFSVTGELASTTPATIEASLGGRAASATVFVYDDTLPREVVDLAPATLTVRPGGSATLTVELDLPAPSSGLEVGLSSEEGLLTDLPATVLVEGGARFVPVPIQAGEKTGTATVTATWEKASASAEVVIEESTGTGLIFSEYLEGSRGNNKYVEIKNLEAGDLDLDDCQVKVYSNGGSSANNTTTLDSVSLGAGELFLLCHSSADFKTGKACDQTTGSLTFNGNDAVELVCPSGVQDIIGQIGTDPGDSWGTTAVTKDLNLRRDCEVEIGDRDGSDAFVPEDEWEAGKKDDASDLGLDHCSAP